MHPTSLDNLAIALARNRAAGTTSRLALGGVVSRQEADEIQLAALQAYDSDVQGYALAGTSAASQRVLGLHEPIFGPITSRDFFHENCRLHLPQGIIGAQCELAFIVGNSYPDRHETVDRESVGEVIVACRPTIDLLGRRAFGARHRDVSAVADFGLHVATICGPAVRADWERLDQIGLTARINGQIVATARGSAVLGHPLEAVAHLARKLAIQGRQINAGEVVTTGSWSPILQVLPGQTLSVEIDTIGQVACSFD